MLKLSNHFLMLLVAALSPQGAEKVSDKNQESINFDDLVTNRHSGANRSPENL